MATRSVQSIAVADADGRRVAFIEQFEGRVAHFLAVQDVLIDSSGKVSAVLITPSGSASSAGQASHIPWDAVRSIEADGKITVDASRVQSASSAR